MSPLANLKVTRQRALIDTVAQGPAALTRYLMRMLRVTDAPELRAAVPALPNPLTAAAMQRLPRYDEEKIAESLQSVSPAEAVRSARSLISYYDIGLKEPQYAVLEAMQKGVPEDAFIVWDVTQFGHYARTH